MFFSLNNFIHIPFYLIDKFQEIREYIISYSIVTITIKSNKTYIIQIWPNNDSIVIRYKTLEYKVKRDKLDVYKNIIQFIYSTWSITGENNLNVRRSGKMLFNVEFDSFDKLWTYFEYLIYLN